MNKSMLRSFKSLSKLPLSIFVYEYYTMLKCGSFNIVIFKYRNIISLAILMLEIVWKGIIETSMATLQDLSKERGKKFLLTMNGGIETYAFRKLKNQTQILSSIETYAFRKAFTQQF